MKNQKRRKTDFDDEKLSKKIKVEKTLNKILIGILVLIAMSMGAGMYLYLFDMNPPLIIHNNPIPTDKSTYHLGEDIYVTFDYCRYTDAPVERYISFIDGMTFQLPPVYSAGGEIGCNINKTKIATVPLSLPTGIYHLRGKSEYDVNFLATRYVTWESEEFQVVK
ncbi:MAG: hypothetical protein WA061_02350 [Microgenomates group bacterium]